MAQAVLLAKRPRPNYSLSNLEQQRPGASTPGWLAKTQARVGADTPGGGSGDSPESNGSSKENKVPAGRGRVVTKKPVARPDAPAQEGKPAGRKADKQPARRAKSADVRHKHAEPADVHKAVKRGRKSAPVRADKPAQPKHSGQPAAESPAASDGSKGRRKLKTARKARSPPEKAAGPAVSGGKDAAAEPPQPVAQSSAERKGRAANKRASTEQAQPADKGPKRRRGAASDRIGEQPAAAAVEPTGAAAGAPAGAAAEAGATATPAGASLPPRRSSARAHAAGSPAATPQPAGHGARGASGPRAAARAADTAQRPAPANEQSAEGAAGGASQAGDPVSSTPGSDLARRVDANISALQVLPSTTAVAQINLADFLLPAMADYAKLQAAYQAMKRQSAHPQSAAAVPVAAPAPPSDSFLKLQAAHEELLQRYKDLKAKKMEGLQDVLAAQAAQVEEHRAAANKVAEHWKAEAQRHEAAAAAAQAPQMQAELKALRDGRQRLMEQALDMKAGIAERESRIAQLQHQLARARLDAQLAETAQAAAEHAAAQLRQAAEVKQAQQKAAAVVEDVLQQLEAGAAAQPGAAEPQPVDAEAAVATADMPADATIAPCGDQVTASPTVEPQLQAHAPQPTPFHLKEARAMCPEGLSLSDTYCQPSASSSQPSGHVHIDMTGQPLVPYHNGASRELPDGAAADGSQSTVRTPGPGADAAAEASPSQTQCGALPGIGGGTPSNASLPVRHLQFASAARAAGQPPAAEVVQAVNAATAQAAMAPGTHGNPLQILTGFESSPFKNGGFLFEHHASGYTFRLMPLVDDELLYRPYTLGELHDDMPAFLRSELTIHIGQRNKLLNHIMDVLARHTGGDSLGANS